MRRPRPPSISGAVFWSSSFPRSSFLMKSDLDLRRVLQRDLVVIVADKTGPLFWGKFLFHISDLLAMAAAAAVQSGLWREILVGTSMTYNAFNVHQSVLAVQPHLFLVAVAFDAVLAVGFHMGFAGCDGGEREDEHQKYQYKPIHSASLVKAFTVVRWENCREAGTGPAPRILSSITCPPMRSSALWHR